MGPHSTVLAEVQGNFNLKPECSFLIFRFQLTHCDELITSCRNLIAEEFACIDNVPHKKARKRGHEPVGYVDDGGRCGRHLSLQLEQGDLRFPAHGWGHYGQSGVAVGVRTLMRPYTGKETQKE